MLIKRFAAALALLPILFLSGCWDSLEIDEHIFLLTLALDVSDGGGVKISTAITPSKPNSEEGGGSEKDGKNELVVSVGRSFAETLDVLSAGLPRYIDFTQLKFIIISEELAKSDMFVDTLSELLTCKGVRRTSSVVICQGKAEDYLKEVGSVDELPLGKSLEIAVEAFHESSNVAPARLIDLYFELQSMYGTAYALHGALAPSTSTDDIGTPPAGKAQPGDYSATELPYRGPNSPTIFGTALFNKSRMAGTLTGFETQQLLMLRGESSKALVYTPIGASPEETFSEIMVRCDNRPTVTVSGSDDALKIVIALKLEGMLAFPAKQTNVNYDELSQSVSAELENTFQALVNRLKEEELDPIGFSSYVVPRFKTIQEWQAYDWASAYKNAEIAVSVNLYIQKTGLEPGGIQQLQY